MDKKDYFFWHPTLQSLGNFSHIVACRSSYKNTRKMNLQPILNKNLPWIHMESKFDVLGITRKLVKYVVHSFKKKIEKNKKYNSSHMDFHLSGWKAP
jgi:hypothetical protein